uniref:BHLH domain-containing protein n=1 Tax=Parascaris univalens TaxID=6257 RepID=A0A915A4I1_PARUN
MQMDSTICPDTSIDSTLPDDDEWEDEGRRSPTRSRASTSNHSEIEKRRRDRMNELISQLSALVPAAFKRKLDKLSVLRLTLQHINSISSTGDRELDYSGCAKHLPLHELLFLLEKCIDSFIVVTDLDSGNILYASESVAESTSVAADEIVSRNWFDLLHPDDTQAFKNEMMTFFTESRTSADTGATYLSDSVSSSTGHFSQRADFNTGLKRSFVCRIKLTSEQSSSTTNPYCKYRCFGFLRKSNTPVAVLLLMKSSDEFHAGERFQMKISVNGRITHCDPELSGILGYLPHRLLGTSYYDIVYEGDLLDVSHHHKQVVKSNESREASYRLRCESENCLMIDSLWRPFVNPWTSEMQFINIMHSASALRNDEELSAAQSTLKQLLSGKRGAGSSAMVPILGAARFGEAIEK